MKRLLTILCVILISASACHIANAYSESIRLQEGESVTRTVRLSEGSEVSGRITIVGNAINFSVSGPDDRIIQNYTVSSPTNFRFTATKAGTYNFHFENLFSNEVKFVSFNYNVQHYVFGLPQEYVLVFVIVGLALVAVIMFVALSPKP